MRGLLAEKARKEGLAQIGSDLAEDELAQISEQLQKFKSSLEKFASDHNKDIKKNPVFRRDFQRMCTQIGVDPLASKKGFWSELLGVSDFYYELGVQIVEVCLSTRQKNGGLIELSELRVKVTERRGHVAQDVNEEDLERAIKKLATLGRGFSILQLGTRKLVQSVPAELNTDHAAVLALAESSGHVSVAEAMARLSWSRERAGPLLELLVKEGMAWIDDQHTDRERHYWFPALL